MATDAPEHLRGERYLVRGLLGEGSQGSTLDAFDDREQRPVAIKRFVVRGARSWKDVELAEREAKVLSSLSHPRLPAYVEHFEEDGALYLVMEKIEGEPLFRAGRPDRYLRMGEGEVVRMLREVGEVLAYLHRRAPPIVHRDVKPGNVIRRPDGSFALIDFGAVRDRIRPEGGSTVVGTFGYMAPEQFQGRASPASDVYSLGMTALVLLTGREPEELPHKGLGVDVRAARGDDPLSRVLAQMVEPDPDQRASSIESLLAVLASPPRASQPPAGASPPHAPRSQARAADPLGRIGEELGAEIAEGVGGLVRAIGEIVHDAEAAAEVERARPRGARREERRAERRERLEERIERRVERFQERLERERRRTEAWRRPPGARRGPAPPVAAVALVLAELAVTLATRLIVPTVLTLLSLFFGKALARAAAHVDKAGRSAVGRLRAERLGSPAPPLPVRVDEEERAAQVRVAPEEPPAGAEAQTELQREAEREAEREAAQAAEQAAAAARARGRAS